MGTLKARWRRRAKGLLAGVTLREWGMRPENLSSRPRYRNVTMIITQIYKERRGGGRAWGESALASAHSDANRQQSRLRCQLRTSALPTCMQTKNTEPLAKEGTDEVAQSQSGVVALRQITATGDNTASTTATTTTTTRVSASTRPPVQ